MAAEVKAVATEEAPVQGGTGASGGGEGGGGEGGGDGGGGEGG
eukprot:CAMPEP_0119060994 /NCGR_PEP_ID=MMETSP1178-20130426/4874_1 /TAXON_ID=33656 /ORGANISM="unid sp, Strain CCMP2000" /LENGTH=42 /DNA_ID= /DNA_START= /DNA_END= /DNA_ORIENTATION=